MNADEAANPKKMNRRDTETAEKIEMEVWRIEALRKIGFVIPAETGVLFKSVENGSRLHEHDLVRRYLIVFDRLLRAPVLQFWVFSAVSASRRFSWKALAGSLL